MLSLLLAASAAACTPARGDATAILQRAATAMGIDQAGSRVLHIRGYDVTSQDFQSDRTNYPPFLSNVERIDYWYSPATRAERRSANGSMAGGEYGTPATLGVEQAAFAVVDTGVVPSAGLHAASYVLRPLNPWAVVADWARAANARVVERCDYRDYPRLVLTRTDARTPERLYIDEKSGLPVKLERDEPHYLWGQVRAEYVYSTWQRVGETAFPGVSFRMADGRVNSERNLSSVQLAPADSAPRFTVPTSVTLGYDLPAFLQPTKPDTIRVSANAFLLRNRGYAEMVAQVGDTVYLFDATQGDERARQDSAWIAALFPTHKAVALVVSDLAWPHIAGVRFWVARGATVYAHRAARSMLDSVVARRWTLAPDVLERSRARLRFVPVADTLRLGRGAVRLFAIDGASSEVALAAYLPAEQFLWASDYIQSAREPTMYLDEMCRATKRVGITPVRTAAEHLPITSWSKLVPLARCD